MKALCLAAALLAGSITPGFSAGYDELNAGIAARNRRDCAIAHFDKALAASDLVPDQRYIANFDRGMAHAAKGDLDDAIGDYSAGLELRPGDPLVLYTRAQAYMAKGNLDAARHDADTLISGDADDTDAYILRCRIYAYEGDFGEALNDVQILVAKDPKNISNYIDLGVANFLVGRADQAAAIFAKASENSNSYSYAWLWLAITNLKQKKPVSQDVGLFFDLTKWPGPLLDFYRGRISEEALTAASAKGDTNVLKGQSCERSFFLGEWHFLHDEKPAARPLLEQAVHDCRIDFVGSYAARTELKNDF